MLLLWCREKRGPVRFKLSSLYPLNGFAMVNVRDLAGVVNAWKLLISPDPRQKKITSREPQTQGCGSGSGIRCPFESWIRDRIGVFRIPDLGDPIHISYSLVKNFRAKSTMCFVSWPKHFCTVPYLFENIYFKFCDICGYKKVRQQNVSPSSFVVVGGQIHFFSIRSQVGAFSPLCVGAGVYARHNELLDQAVPVQGLAV